MITVVVGAEDKQKSLLQHKDHSHDAGRMHKKTEAWKQRGNRKDPRYTGMYGIIPESYC